MNDTNRDAIESAIFLWGFLVVIPVLGILGLLLG